MKKQEPLINKKLSQEEFESRIKAGSSDFSGEDLSGLALAVRALQNTNFDRANLSNTYLMHSRLGYNEGQELSEGGVLTSFREANLTNAYLTNAYANGVDFRRANLEQGSLGDANLKKANFTQANLTKANLKGADLDEADLTGANLTGANLVGTNLSDAKIEGAIFVGIIQRAVDDLMFTRENVGAKKNKFEELTTSISNLFNNDGDVDLSLEQKKQVLGIDGVNFAESSVFKYLESNSSKLKRILGGDEELNIFKEKLTKTVESLRDESSKSSGGQEVQLEEGGAAKKLKTNDGASLSSSGGQEISDGSDGMRSMAERVKATRSEPSKSSGR